MSTPCRRISSGRSFRPISHQRLAEMVESAGDELDGLAGIVDRLAARLGLLVGLALGFLVGAFLRGDLGLDLAPRLLFELLLGGGLGSPPGACARRLTCSAFRRCSFVGAQLGRLLLGLEAPALRPPRPRARLDRLRIGAARGDGVVAAAAQQGEQHDRDARSTGRSGWPAAAGGAAGDGRVETCRALPAAPCRWRPWHRPPAPRVMPRIGRQPAMVCGRSLATTARPASMPASTPGEKPAGLSWASGS